MTTIADTPDSIAYAQALVFRSRLKLEISGMKSRVNTLKGFNAVYGTNHKTRKAALANIEGALDLVKNHDHVFFPAGDGTVGLYERAELLADLQAQGVLV